jgi:hypothetical protein
MPVELSIPCYRKRFCALSVRCHLECRTWARSLADQQEVATISGMRAESSFYIVRVRRLFIATFALCFPLFGCSAFGQAQETKSELVKVEYNQQKDITQISLKPILLASRKNEVLRVGAVASHPGKIRVRPREVALLFIYLSTSDTNKYEAARMLTVITNEQKFPFGETRHSKGTQNGLFVETMAAIIPMESFLRISWSKEVTMKLGLTEIKLSPNQISQLRAVASYMTQ